MKKYPAGSKQHKLKILMAESQLSFQELGDLMGISKQMVNKLVRSGRAADHERIRAAIKAASVR